MPDGSNRHFVVIASRNGHELGRKTVVAKNPDQAIVAAQWDLVEELHLNFHDIGVMYEARPDSIEPDAWLEV